jgi:hypothetical protein
MRAKRGTSQRLSRAHPMCTSSAARGSRERAKSESNVENESRFAGAFKRHLGHLVYSRQKRKNCLIIRAGSRRDHARTRAFKARDSYTNRSSRASLCTLFRAQSQTCPHLTRTRTSPWTCGHSYDSLGCDCGLGLFPLACASAGGGRRLLRGSAWGLTRPHAFVRSRAPTSRQRQFLRNVERMRALRSLSIAFSRTRRAPLPRNFHGPQRRF